MMTRKDTIFEYVKQNASIESEGYTTTEISEALGIIRNNVSKELNVLVREEASKNRRQARQVFIGRT